MIEFNILSIFPDIFDSFLNESIIKRAILNKAISVNVFNIRDYSKDKHKKVDDSPYGGGAGMLFMPQPLFDCIEDVKNRYPDAPVIYLSPRGQRFNQVKAERLNKKFTQYILLCGHYEGIDQRVIDELVDFELSIGDYVLSGGELATMVFVDVISRINEGVLGNSESHKEESFSKRLKRKKEYPHYTKPSNFRGLKVPDVLLSGNHAEIEKWRMKHLK